MEISTTTQIATEICPKKISILPKRLGWCLHLLFSNLLLLSVLFLLLSFCYSAFSLEKISIPIDRIKIIDLGATPDTVRISEPEVIDVERIGITNTIKVTAKQYGQSKIIATYNDGKEKTWEVTVVRTSSKEFDTRPLDTMMEQKNSLDGLIKDMNIEKSIKFVPRNGKYILSGSIKNLSTFQKLSSVVAAHPAYFFPIYSIPEKLEKSVVNFLQTQLQTLGEKKLSIIQKSGLLVLTGIPSSPQGKRKTWEYLSSLVPNIVDSMGATTGESTVVQINLDFWEVSRSQRKQTGVKNSLMDGALSTFQFSPIDVATGVAASPTLNIAPWNVLMTALHTKNSVKNIAKPVVLTRSGEKASFLAGGEVPIVSSIAVSNGVASSVNYKPFGIGFQVTPVLQVDGDIWLQLDLDVSDIAEQLSYNGMPGFSTKKISTQLVLSEGNSAILSGLIQNKTTKQVSAVPWLSNIPILGSLFKSKDFQDSESELWVSITATKVIQKRLNPLVSFG